ncbi:Gfo/Idh/MocA family protein [Streptomyces sp. NPDC057101]|uniref:Gfo/Idh/MocA family protein n=1 Tax=Streptomyces sp. NPDC057101 TaxID=3346020 RepID=UPI00362F4A63
MSEANMSGETTDGAATSGAAREAGSASPVPVEFAIVGRGWRADFYLRVARLVPERFRCLGVVTRDADAGARLEREWGVPTYRSPKDLAAACDPEVVVTSVPRAVNPAVVRELVSLGLPVLSETPPARDGEGLRELWASVGDSGLVQVAEQNPYLPIMTALRAPVLRDALGELTSVHVSWTHDYHAMALARSFLRLEAEPARVTAFRTEGPLLEGPGRGGRPTDPRVRRAAHTLAVLESRGVTAVYDFTDTQWFHPLRRSQLILRGSHGEVVGGQVTWADDDGTVHSAPVHRRQTGWDGDLEGADLDTLTWAGHVLYRNPYRGARLSDEEIAIATCLERTAMWRRGQGPAPYPLAHACQDHLLSLAIHAAARDRSAVTTGREAWAAAVDNEVAGPLAP